MIISRLVPKTCVLQYVTVRNVIETLAVKYKYFNYTPTTQQQITKHRQVNRREVLAKS